MLRTHQLAETWIMFSISLNFIFIFFIVKAETNTTHTHTQTQIKRKKKQQRETDRKEPLMLHLSNASNNRAEQSQIQEPGI